MTSKRLNLSVQYACNQGGFPSRPQIRAWVRAALDVDGKRGGWPTTAASGEAEQGKQQNLRLLPKIAQRTATTPTPITT